MVRGQSITPEQKRRLLARIRAERNAIAATDAYVLELSEAGISVQSMMQATGERGADTHVPHSTLHTRVQRAREARDHD